MHVKPNISRFVRLAAVVAALAAVPALADSIPGLGNPVKPRVMIIMDSSRSMSEPTSAPAPTTWTSPWGNGGDYDCSGSLINAPCTNKFCTAKQVVCTTMPKYTDGAVIGLSTYYQYVIDRSRPNNMATTCTYDVLEKAGLVRTFTSTVDINNSFLTVPGPAGSADLTGGGLPLSGSCVAGAASTYSVTKTSAVATGAPVDSPCYLSNRGTLPAGFPANLTPPNCSAQYFVGYSPSPTIVTGIRYRVAVGSTCPAVVTGILTNTPSGPASFTVPGSAVPPAGAASNQCAPAATGVGCFSQNANQVNTSVCTAAYPCHLYSTSITPYLDGGKAWYGFFNTATFTPAPTFGTAGVPAIKTYDYSTNVGRNGPVLFTGTTVSNVTGCNVRGGFTFAIGDTNRIIDTTPITQFGFTAANFTGNATIGLAAVPAPTAGGARIDDSPTGATYRCLPGFPCDVKMSNMNFTWQAPSGTTSAPDPLCTTVAAASATGTVCASLATCNSVGPTLDTTATFYTTRPAASCAATFTANAAAVTPPQGILETTATFSGVSNWPATCGAGTATCTFQSTASTTRTPSCAAFSAWDNPTAVASGSTVVAPTPAHTACAQNGDSWVVTYTTGATAQSFQAPSGSCPASATLASGTGYTMVGGACASYPCVITATGSATELQQQITNVAPAGTGWVATTGGQTNRGVVVPDPGSCSLATAATRANCVAGAVTCPASGTVVASAGFAPTGTVVATGTSVPTGSNTCGSEGNAPCHQCGYQPVQFEYRRLRCDFSAKKTNFTASTVPSCAYQRRVYTAQRCQSNCQFQVSANRYNFDQPNAATCDYSMIKTRLQTQGASYTYQYATKGGELWGTWNKGVAGASYCGATCPITGLPGNCTYAAANPFEGACAERINECTGVGLGQVCKLRNSTASGSGRYANMTNAYLTSTASAGVTQYWDPLNPLGTSVARRECLAPEATPLTSSDSAATANGNIAKFCAASGYSALEEHRLVSDWYDPTFNGNLATVNGLWTADNAAMTPPQPAWATVAWSKPAAITPKASGWSAEGGAVGISPTRSQIWIDVPDDGPADGYDPLAHAARIRGAMKNCNPPRITNGNIVSGSTNWDRTTSGVCMVDEADRQAPSWSTATDFTPLYGSLANSAKYLADRLDNDPDSECRDYFLVLVTDGVENTPNHTMAELPGLVSSFRTLISPTTSHKADLRTFVVGFGTGAGVGTLDSMAAAGADPAIGMQSTAYSATSLTTLQQTLDTIFSTITAGTFSRSKPTIASDGNRIYAASFTKVGGTPEWRGELNAYKIDSSTGDFKWQWDLSDKLLTQTDGSRNLRVAISDATGATVNFNAPAALSTLDLLLKADPGYPGGLSTTTLVDFIRNKTVSSTGTGGAPYSSGTTLRASKLGSIIHSSPVVVGKSPFDSSWGGNAPADRTAFQAFVASTATREPRVLIGTNDGLLRGVREGTNGVSCGIVTDGGVPNDSDPACDNGKEAWGFVPVHTLRNLYQQRLGGRLDTVDGLTNVSEICSNGGNAAGCSSAQWKTVAIGSMRGGGRGIFALDVTDPSVAPSYLWGFDDSNLGYTFSPPAVGRVEHGGVDKFIAILPGGKDSGGGGGNEGRSVFAINAYTGALIKEFSSVSTGGSSHGLSLGADLIARPATHRIPNNAYLFSAYLGAADGSLYAMRFTKGQTDDSMESNADKWEPEEFWDPTSSRSTDDINGNPVPLTRVAEQTPATSPPTWVLVKPSDTPDDENGNFSTNDSAEDTFPMNAGQRRSLFNRPKIVPVLDTAGRLPDLFLGTGDTEDPAAPRASMQRWNYFVALHDTNSRHHGSKNSARTMWAHYFLDPTEQVVSEPAIVNGAVIVATYTPPPTGSACKQEGETTLYCFDPKDGRLVKCLVYMTGANAGKSTEVLKMGGIGIPSDLLVIGSNLYMASSSGGLMKQKIKVAPPAGDVRSYRRLR